MIAVTYREGDCWSVAELEEFSVAGIRPHVQYDITTITYFNSDGESRNWIAPTAVYCGSC